MENIGEIVYFGLARASAAGKRAALGIPNEVLGWLAAGAVLALALAVLWFLAKKRKLAKFCLSMDMVLLSVRIPQKSAEEVQQSGRQEKDWIKVMEDFNANLITLKPKGLLAPKPWLALEIAR